MESFLLLKVIYGKLNVNQNQSTVTGKLISVD